MYCSWISGGVCILCLMVTYPAQSIEVAVRAPVGCYVEECYDKKHYKCETAKVCDGDISVHDINNYDNMDEKLFSQRDMYSATERDICGIHSPQNWSYEWAKIEKINNGTLELSKLLAHAQDGKPFGKVIGTTTWPNTQHQIIETDNSTPNEQHLALCEVHVLSNAVGPPINCGTVAIITSPQIWLRGTSVPPNTPYGCSAASLRSTSTVDIKFRVLDRLKKQISIKFLSDTLKDMLTKDLGLTVETTTTEVKGRLVSVQLYSVAPLRDSTILQGGWREALDFDLTLDREQAGIRIHGVAHAMVSRQALGSVTQYQGPDDKQRATYASTLDSKVSAAITYACKSFKIKDAGTIACE